MDEVEDQVEAEVSEDEPVPEEDVDDEVEAEAVEDQVESVDEDVALGGVVVEANLTGTVELHMEILDPIAEAEPVYIEDAVAAGPREIHWAGPIVFENQYTGDGRIWESSAIYWDETLMPLPFRWQRISNAGHLQSLTIGRVDAIWRDDAYPGVIFGRGVLLPDTIYEAQQYLDLLRAQAAGGVSVDGDSATYETLATDGGERYVFSSMRLRGLTAVDIPAFAEAKIFAFELAAEEPIALDTLTVTCGLRAARKRKDRTYEADAIVAGAYPVDPPSEWMRPPAWSGPTAMTYEDSGRVYGHIALSGQCHIGMAGQCIDPPMNGAYPYFAIGELKTIDGESFDVGHITFDTGHADLHVSALAAAGHYDNTGCVGADVCIGEDEWGIWVAGALRPEITPTQLRALRSAPISGDWRKLGRKMELVALLSVNTPGFPVPRVKALTASAENGLPDAALLTVTPETLAVAKQSALADQKMLIINRMNKQKLIDFVRGD